MSANMIVFLLDVAAWLLFTDETAFVQPMYAFSMASWLSTATIASGSMSLALSTGRAASTASTKKFFQAFCGIDFIV